MKANDKRMVANELIYPKLSYQLMGVLFRVQRKLGSSYQEKYYQRAVEVELKKEQIPYKREVAVKLGIVANFRTGRLTYKRLVNPRVKL